MTVAKVKTFDSLVLNARDLEFARNPNLVLFELTKERRNGTPSVRGCGMFLVYA